jgi:hypothetical protein
VAAFSLSPAPATVRVAPHSLSLLSSSSFGMELTWFARCCVRAACAHQLDHLVHHLARVAFAAVRSGTRLVAGHRAWPRARRYALFLSDVLPHTNMTI